MTGEGDKVKNINGGPAFPTDGEHRPDFYYMHYEGMTLRDYFANSAMLGIISCSTEPSVRQIDWPRAVSAQSYKIADAMLAAREMNLNA